LDFKILTQDWRQILRSNYTNWEKLADFLSLPQDIRDQIIIQKHFPLNLPIRLAEKIEKGNFEDPILKQFLPTTQEKIFSNGYLNDPVGDQSSRCGPKLLHKYQGRVLFVTTGACAMHCRYCFRQNFDYDVADKTFALELEQIANDKTIFEIILSGGDPLSLPNRTLKCLIDKIALIPHIKRIRFHTRFPIGIPERIDEEFLDIIRNTPIQFWFVIHCNHPQELDETIFYHLNLLRKCGVNILNQAVLLKGVNDNADTLTELCLSLVDNGISPYYIHQLDRVQGAAHFEVPEEDGLRLIKEISRRLPGYALPKYVREIPGQPCKTPII
jgi:EF-P beta-lysylation protein EpmB